MKNVPLGGSLCYNAQLFFWALETLLKETANPTALTSTTIHTDNITRVVAVVGSYTAQMSSVYKDLQWLQLLSVETNDSYSCTFSSYTDCKLVCIPRHTILIIWAVLHVPSRVYQCSSTLLQKMNKNAVAPCWLKKARLWRVSHAPY